MFFSPFSHCVEKKERKSLKNRKKKKRPGHLLFFIKKTDLGINDFFLD